MYYDTYSREDIVQDFARRHHLLPAEFAALGQVWPLVQGDVLDLGVGGGRTTAYLYGVARSYRALDISERMAAACRATHPAAEVDVGDARTLEGHHDGAYDLVLFSFNGIDYIAHAERALVLASAWRVLRPGGAFVYSSHNLGVLGGQLPGISPVRLVPTPNPVRLAVRGVRALGAMVRRHRNRQLLGARQYLGDGHALVNDESYDHAQLTVYVDPAREAAALVAAGFHDVQTVDARGRIDPPRHDDPWVYFIARKPRQSRG
ncbi:MAG TPA: class I SAM-dependent methyltransferase [Luteimonas sp.]